MVTAAGGKVTDTDGAPLRLAFAPPFGAQLFGREAVAGVMICDEIVLHSGLEESGGPVHGIL